MNISQEEKFLDFFHIIIPKFTFVAINTEYLYLYTVIIILFRYRAFLGNISIVIPKTWSSQAVDHPFTYEAGARDIWIENPGEPPYHAPHVKGLHRCGAPADYIMMTPGYIMDEAIADQYGPRKKVRVQLIGMTKEK